MSRPSTGTRKDRRLRANRHLSKRKTTNPRKRYRRR